MWRGAAEKAGRGKSRKRRGEDSQASSGNEEGRCSDLYFTTVMLMQRMDCRGAGWSGGRALRPLFLSRWGITKD